MTTVKVSVPIKPITLTLDVHVEFDTAKDDHFDIKIDSMRRILNSDAPAEERYGQEQVSVSINGAEPTLMLSSDFIKKMYVINKFYGMKNIKRSAHGFAVEEHKSFYEFAEHQRDELCVLLFGDDEEPAYSDSYTLNVLFGIICDVNLH